MVYSSHQTYFDPSNWHQQQSHQIIGSGSTNPLLPPQPYSGPQPSPQTHGGAGVPGSIRPGSMAERARMANVPMPETSLKCPRCESPNTKFCYFNNYSLSQPRHFCKTCRRYWTRGGALRSVPVGGGCRRNKRSKSTTSKSPANRGDGQTTSSSTSSMSTNSGTTAANILGLTPPQLAPLRFMSPLSQLTDSFANDLGLNYSGISGPMVGSSEMNFRNNLLGAGGVANFLSGGGGSTEPWRLQQFPFLGGLESNLNGIYQFQGGESGFVGGGEVMRPKFSASMLSQLASMKMEDNAAAELNHSRELLGGSGVAAGNSNDHHWNNNNNNSNSGAAPNWTDLSSFSSSSTGNPL